MAPIVNHMHSLMVKSNEKNKKGQWAKQRYIIITVIIMVVKDILEREREKNKWLVVNVEAFKARRRIQCTKSTKNSPFIPPPSLSRSLS